MIALASASRRAISRSAWLSRTQPQRRAIPARCSHGLVQRLLRAGKKQRRRMEWRPRSKGSGGTSLGAWDLQVALALRAGPGRVDPAATGRTAGPKAHQDSRWVSTSPASRQSMVRIPPARVRRRPRSDRPALHDQAFVVADLAAALATPPCPAASSQPRASANEPCDAEPAHCQRREAVAGQLPLLPESGLSAPSKSRGGQQDRPDRARWACGCAGLRAEAPSEERLAASA